MDRDGPEWTIEYEGAAFERFFTKLGGYEQAVLVAAIEHVLKVHGMDICQGASSDSSTATAAVRNCRSSETGC